MLAVIGNACEHSSAQREETLPFCRQREIPGVALQIDDLFVACRVPTEETPVFPRRFGELRVVRDPIGRGICNRLSAVDVICNGIGVDLPFRRDRQLAFHRVASLGAVPTREGISLAGKGRIGDRVAVAHRLRRVSGFERSAVADESDGISIAGIVEFQNERAVRRDGAGLGAVRRIVGKVRIGLLLRRDARRGRARQGYGFGEVVSRGVRVLQIVFNGIGGVCVGRPNRVCGEIPHDRLRKVVVPPGEFVTGACGRLWRDRITFLDLDRIESRPAAGCKRNGINRAATDRDGIERDPLAVLRRDQKIECIVARRQRNGLGRDAVDAVDIGADLPGRFRADSDLTEEGVGFGCVRKNHRKRVSIDGKAGRVDEISGGGIVRDRQRRGQRRCLVPLHRDRRRNGIGPGLGLTVAGIGDLRPRRRAENGKRLRGPVSNILPVGEG